MFHDSQKSDGLLNSLDIDRLHDVHNVTAVTTATATAAIVVFLHYSHDSDRLYDSSSSAVYVQLVVYYSMYV